MYPSPNRVQDGVLWYEQERHRYWKKGQQRIIHGLVYDEVWQADVPVVTDTSVSVTGRVVFAPGSEIFDCFPWESVLSVTWTLGQEGLVFSYEVKNMSDRPLPYGIGIHAYYPVRAWHESAMIRLPAQKMFEASPERYPSGKLLDVAGTKFDLNEETPVSSLDIDDAYTGLEHGSCSVRYGTKGFTLHWSEDFGKVILFTPDQLFFCIENQTTMTNAHRFFHEGYPDSGIRLVPVQETRTGWVMLTPY